jgi:hypothetical protein
MVILDLLEGQGLTHGTGLVQFDELFLLLRFSL